MSLVASDPSGGGSEQSGLYEKYEVRKDGEIVEDCFVLEPESDEAAQAALATYALETDDEDLFEDLDAWLQDLDFTDEAVVLAMGWTEQIAHFLEMYFIETGEDAYSPTSYHSAYLARELRERAGLASQDLLEDEPDAPSAFRSGDGGESDAE